MRCKPVSSAPICPEQLFHLFDGKKWHILFNASLAIKTINVVIQHFMNFG